MFEGFALEDVDVGAVTLRVRHGGRGPAILLLHAHPRTHATWHRVAPLLADTFTVVCPDLRGYGRSSKPPTTPDHAPYSKRAMGQECAELKHELGHERFAVVGHDRGGYVAPRLAVDHHARVSQLVVMDAVPIGAALARCDATFAASWWHWFFLGQTDKPAEPMICADPDAWYRIRGAERPVAVGRALISAAFRGSARNPEATADRDRNRSGLRPIITQAGLSPKPAAARACV
jgi:haloacetate dehalogenase